MVPHTQAHSQFFDFDPCTEREGEVDVLKATTGSVHHAPAGIGLGGGIWSMQTPVGFRLPPAAAPFAVSHLHHGAVDFRPAPPSSSDTSHLNHTAAKTCRITLKGSDTHMSNQAHRDIGQSYDRPPLLSLSSYLEGSFAASSMPEQQVQYFPPTAMLPPVIAFPGAVIRKPNQTTTTTRILLPAWSAGCIIGRGGDVIKSIREVSGAHITILESGTDNRSIKYRMVALAGTIPAVGAAIQMIGIQANLFDDDLSARQGGNIQAPSGAGLLHDPHSSIASPSLLPRQPQPLYDRAGRGKATEMLGGAGAGEDKQSAAGDMEVSGIRLIIDAGMVGQLLSRRGWRVNDIRAQTGVRRIHVLNAGESQLEGSIRNERVVVVLGTAEQCRRAHQHISLILEADPISLEHWEQQRGRNGQDSPIDDSVAEFGLARTLMEGPASFQRMSLRETTGEGNRQDMGGAGWDQEAHTHAAGEKQEKDEGNEEDREHDEMSETISGLLAPKAKDLRIAKSLGMAVNAVTGAENISGPSASAIFSSSSSAAMKEPFIATSAPIQYFTALAPPPRPSSSSSSSSWVDESDNTSESLSAGDQRKVTLREFSAEVVVRISNDNIGKLIGKEGSTIRRLRHESQCRIEIDDYRHPADSAMREVRIRGHIQQIHVATAMVAHQLFGPEDGGLWY